MHLDIPRRMGGRPAPAPSSGGGVTVTSTFVSALAAVAAMFPIVWSIMAAPAAWAPASDSAIIVLRARDVLTRHTPLVGMPTTLSATAGTQLHHPGPLEMWLLALPSTIITAPMAPMVAIAIVNAVAALGIVWWACKAGGPAVGMAVGLALGACLWPLRGDVLADPYNPFAGLLPFAAFLVGTAAVIERRRWAAPVAVLAGTYAAQSHLALFGLVAGVVAVTSVLAVAGAVGRRRAGEPSELSKVVKSRPFVVAALLALVLWAPVLADELAGEHNLRGLLAASGAGAATLGWAGAGRILANAMGPWPVWAWGHAEVQPLHARPGLAEVAVTVGVIGVAVAGALLHRRRHPALAGATTVCVAGLATGATLLSRLPDSFFNRVALHNYLWLWPLTLLLWVAAAASILTAAARLTARRRVRTALRGAGVAIGCAVALSAAASSSTRPLRPTLQTAVRPLASEAAGSLEPGGRYLVDLTNDLDAATVGSGLVLALERDGFDVVVDDRHAAGFGVHRTRRSQPIVGTLSIVVKRTPVTPEDGTGELVALRTPRPTAVAALDAAQEAVAAEIESHGGLVLANPRRNVLLGPAVDMVEDGSITGPLSFDQVLEPPLSRGVTDRLLRAEAGEIRYVGVFLTSAPAA